MAIIEPATRKTTKTIVWSACTHAVQSLSCSGGCEVQGGGDRGDGLGDREGGQPERQAAEADAEGRQPIHRPLHGHPVQPAGPQGQSLLPAASRGGHGGHQGAAE